MSDETGKYAGRFDYASVLLNLEDDRDLFEALAVLYINESVEYEEQVRAAAKLGDMVRLEHEAHSLKGVLATFANDVGAAAALFVERNAREGQQVTALGGVESLCAEIRQMREILQAELDA